jgi:hypothetical protein
LSAKPQLQEFTYSVVGTNADCELVNVYGFFMTGCREYARRGGVAVFKRNFPNGQIIMSDAAPIRREALVHIPVKP